MKPFFARVGTKRDIVNKLIEYLPEHKIYVEAFVGGGALFWNMNNNKSKKIINDIDSNLIEGYKLLKKNRNTKLIIPPTIEAKQNFVNRKALNDNERLTQILLMTNNTFGSQGKGKIYTNTAHTEKIKKINEYSEKLKNVSILNQDFKKVIKKYDSKDTFFFLDPPYEKSEGFYNNFVIDYEELATILSNIKGLFMLTINDSPVFRKLFKKFKIVPIVVKKKTGSDHAFGGTDRRELIIMNYSL